MRISRRAGVSIGVVVLLLAALYVVYGGGRHMGPGEIHPQALPAPFVAARVAAQASEPPRQILFGDLHVHTTFSADAFMRSMPLLQGEGLHPPADACDYARFCSQLDFFALTDHAESLTPDHWRESQASIEACARAAGDEKTPDLVPFMGFEWSQVGRTPADHWGHRNVIFRDLSTDRQSSRPIAAPGLVGNAFGSRAGLSPLALAAIPIREFKDRDRYLDVARFRREYVGIAECARGVPVRELPTGCREFAETPGELFAKLRDWGFPTLVIPHGTTWGFYTPPGYTFQKSLAASQHDPGMQRLIEVFSGHGNSEEYRDYKDVELDAAGRAMCPAPTADYEPCCHRAGELIRARCGALPAAECEKRVQAAREAYLAAGAAAHLTVPGASVEDWKDCGQCRTCFDPAYQYRPGGSAQFATAAAHFENGAAQHARFGFIASSDNHSARPGTGYKEFARRKLTEATGARDPAWREFLVGESRDLSPEAYRLPDDIADRIPPFRLVDLERQASFFLTGGLVAVHAAGRDREAIWNALQRREVYGTSGDRILLWFSVENAAGGRQPMGAEVKLQKWEAPRFAVRALGAFEQKPGCPDFGAGGLPADRIARICLGECFHPGDRRRRIRRIEVVRIRPAEKQGENVKDLIEDPWKRIECPSGEGECRVTFDDPAFREEHRTVAYYVRAIQEPTPAVNAGGLRCERDASGACLRARPCYGDYRTDFGDDCLADNEERAWSSPIWVAPESVEPGPFDLHQHDGDAPPAAAAPAPVAK